MVKTFPELFKLLNDDVSQFEKMKKDYAFMSVLTYAFDPDKKMILPAGTPAFKPDRAPLGMSPTTLRYESRRLYVFLRTDLKQERREVLFVQMLEGIHPSEAKVLCMIKDQNLHEEYPNLTHEWAASVGLRGPVSKVEQKRTEPETIEEVVAQDSPTEVAVEQVTPEVVEKKTTTKKPKK